MHDITALLMFSVRIVQPVVCGACYSMMMMLPRQRRLSLRSLFVGFYPNPSSCIRVGGEFGSIIVSTHHFSTPNSEVWRSNFGGRGENPKIRFRVFFKIWGQARNLKFRPGRQILRCFEAFRGELGGEFLRPKSLLARRAVIRTRNCTTSKMMS